MLRNRGCDAGLGVSEIWPDSVAFWKQYLFSFYWASSALSGASLVGNTTPKNNAELLFAVWCAHALLLPYKL